VGEFFVDISDFSVSASRVLKIPLSTIGAPTERNAECSLKSKKKASKMKYEMRLKKEASVLFAVQCMLSSILFFKQYSFLEVQTINFDTKVL
jgi:hypothetical protein